MKKLFALLATGLVLSLLLASNLVRAQCTGVFPANTLCGNLTASPAPPAAFSAGGSVVGPGTTVIGHFATWANTVGTLLADFNLFGSNNTWTGTNTFSSQVTFNSTLSGTAWGSPPAIGLVTPAAVEASPLTIGNVLGSTQCLQATSTGLVSGTGAPCGSAPGEVVVLSTGSGYTATAPDGTSISCVGTSTNCWQEAINYAQTNHYNIKILCNTVSNGQPNGTFVTMTSGVSFGPASAMLYEVKGCSVKFTSAVSGPGFVYDTMDQGTDFIWDAGTIYYQGTGNSIVQFYPHTPAPSGGKSFQFSLVKLPYMLAGNTINTGIVRFTSTALGYTIANWNKFYFDGEDGNAAHFYALSCIWVDTPPDVSNAVAQNFIDWGSCQNSGVEGITIGTGAPTGVIATNIWRGMIGTATSTTYGIHSYGQLDQFYINNISVNAGSLTTGLRFESGADHNYIIAPQVQGGTDISDAGTGNCGVVNAKQKSCGSSW